MPKTALALGLQPQRLSPDMAAKRTTKKDGRRNSGFKSLSPDQRKAISKLGGKAVQKARLAKRFAVGDKRAKAMGRRGGLWSGVVRRGKKP